MTVDEERRALIRKLEIERCRPVPPSPYGRPRPMPVERFGVVPDAPEVIAARRRVLLEMDD